MAYILTLDAGTILVNGFTLTRVSPAAFTARIPATAPSSALFSRRIFSTFRCCGVETRARRRSMRNI